MMISWLRLMRAHTAPATVFTLLVPYLLSGGRDPITIASLFLVGHAVHFFSFGHNSLMDYWHDLNDPSKKHHPLISGEIKLDSAHKVIHFGMIATSLVLVMIVVSSSLLALIPLFFYVVFGHAYNDGLNHNTSHSWIPICLSLTSLSAVGWLMNEQKLSLCLSLLLMWSFSTIFYQIAYEGNLKDLWNEAERHNPLRRASKISGDELVGVNSAVSAFFFSIRGIINTAVLLIMAVHMGSGPISYAMMSFFSVVELFAISKLHFKRPIKRSEMLTFMGLAEATEFFRLMSLLEVIGVPLILYGFSYFVLMNRALWGTKLGPRV